MDTSTIALYDKCLSNGYPVYFNSHVFFKLVKSPDTGCVLFILCMNWNILK